MHLVNFLSRRRLPVQVCQPCPPLYSTAIKPNWTANGGLMPTPWTIKSRSGMEANLRPRRQWSRDMWVVVYISVLEHIDGLVQERRNSIAKALELRLSCTKPSICPAIFYRGLGPCLSIQCIPHNLCHGLGYVFSNWLMFIKNDEISQEFDTELF